VTLPPLTISSLLLATAIALPAHACYKVELKNRSDATVAAVWSSGGCFGVYDIESLILSGVCEDKLVPPGQFKVYNYKWGTTSPVLNVVLKKHDDSYGHVQYKYHDEKFVTGLKVSHSVPHCGLHYKVTFTETDLESKE